MCRPRSCAYCHDMIPDVTVTQAVFGDRPRGGRAALVDATSGRTVSYAELAAAVWTAAAGLVRQGLGPGAVVALHLPDTPEFVIAAHAVLAAGATLTLIRPTVTAEAMARRLTETGARAVISWPVLVDIALKAAEATEVERVFCFGSEPDVEPFATLLSGSPAVRPRLDPARDVALIPYTRGTTGPPRAVRLTHRNVVAGFEQASGIFSATDTVLSAIPFADVIGFAGALGPALRAGAMLVTRSGTGRHDLLRALQDHRVTVALLTPAEVEVLAFEQSVGRHDLRALRSIISTSGPLRPEIARSCSVRMRCPVRQAYGLAEASGLTHLNLRAAEEGTLDSVGRGLPGVSWRIIDPATGTDQVSYQAGELRLKGPSVSLSAHEWLPTGDAAFADEHGRVFIMGRMTSAGPEPPTEPEAVLAAHPAVADAAVASIPDRELGLVPHAFVVLRESVSAPDLLAYVNGHLPPYQHVRAVHFTEAIPRSPSGQVLRRALIERARL
jgi:acyl-CoA synthetase (AMP-forming)/AMP-acid ligase II